MQAIAMLALVAQVEGGGIEAEAGWSEVPIAWEDGRLVVRVATAGRESLRFLLDTAAQTTVIGRWLRSGPGVTSLERFAAVHGAGGTSAMERVTLDTLRLAGVSFEGVRAVVMDLQRVFGPGPRIDGILGGDLLSRFDVEIDLPRRRLRLSRPGALETHGMLELRPGRSWFVTFDALVEGRPVRAVLDTGFGEFGILNWQAAETVGIGRTSARVRRSEDGTRGVDGRTVPTHLVRLDSVALGGLRFGGRRARIADLPVFRSFGLHGEPALLVGTAALQGCVVRIAYQARRVRLCDSAENG